MSTRKDGAERTERLRSEPAIVVAAILMMSAGLHQTGLADRIGAWVARATGSGYGTPSP